MALISVATKGLNRADVSLIQLYYGIMSTLIIGVYMLVNGIITDKIPLYGLSWTTWLELIATSVINIVAMSLLTLCNQRGQPTTVGVLMYCGIVYSFLFDMFVFNLSFTGLEYVGVGITLSFNVMAVVWKLLTKKDTK